MSYSFSITANTRAEAEAKAKITLEMAKAMASMPPHVQEGVAVIAAAHALVDTMGESPAPMSISMNGSVSTTDWSDPAAPLTQANCSINVSR